MVNVTEPSAGMTPSYCTNGVPPFVPEALKTCTPAGSDVMSRRNGVEVGAEQGLPTTTLCSSRPVCGLTVGVDADVTAGDHSLALGGQVPSAPHGPQSVPSLDRTRT